MIDDNGVWQDVVPIFENSEEEFSATWDKLEGKFGEFGVAGFSEQTHSAKSSMFGHLNDVDVRYTLYRNEDGKLVFIHSCYINEDGLQKPFIWSVHPDHQRQGLGTMMADYVIKRYENENKEDYIFDEKLSGLRQNTAGATFLNKYAKNKLTTPTE